LQILKKGILTTIQDAGRPGQAAIGVNSGGIMDYFSYRVLNILLDNPAEFPVLEMHFPAPEICFEEECQFALYGADFGAHLNNSPVLNGKINSAKAGDILKFKKRYSGQRCYFGVRGKLDVASWLGSYSQNSALKYPDFPLEISLINETVIQRKYGVVPPKLSKEIRFVPSFEFSDLLDSSEKTLAESEFIISNDSNRMGYRLKGEPLKLISPKEMISSAVHKGTIQLLPNGQLIVLMADAQTTGGYPKLGYVCGVDLNQLTQLGSGESLTFKAISQEEAIAALLQQEAFFDTLKLTLKAFT
jgi:biotin-dependent carboxylase-like uncharacterized protein